MKLIQSIIRPEKLNDVVTALRSVASGMTISEVRGYGHQRGQSAIYRVAEYEVKLLPKIMIEFVADDNKVDDILRIVVQTARTGNIGDGRIFIRAVEQAYHVRTGFMELD